MKKKILIFKNEKIGDLIHSTNAISTLIKNNINYQFIIYLSHHNKDMSFLFDNENVLIKVISDKITIIDKFKILVFIFLNNIERIYIFKPSSFLFFLPFLFIYKKIDFFGICVKKSNYFRPSKFFRRLFKYYVINDRETQKIRKSIYNLHMNLVDQNDIIYESFKTPKGFKFKDINKEKYLLIHYNKLKFNELGWTLNDLSKIIENLISMSIKVCLTNDLNDKETTKYVVTKFNSNKLFQHYPNITGKSFFNLIGNSNLVISMHGSITSIAAFQNVKVIDLFDCNINEIKDMYRYKNSFHEFKPKKNNYEFLIPKKNIDITLKRIVNLIENGRKISN